MNCYPQLFNPLHIAAIVGDHDHLHVLIYHGADVNERDNFTTTALHRAAENGHYLCLKALLEAGADCNAPIFDMPLRNIQESKWERDTHPVSYVPGTTALHLAVANNHIFCVKELLKFGAKFNAFPNFGDNREMAKVFIRCGVDIGVIETEKLLREEFYVPGEEDLFKCLVKRLPVLPCIGRYSIFAYVQGDLLGSTLPDNIEVKFFLNYDEIGIRIQKRGFKNTTGELPRFLFLRSLREPLLGVIYNRVTEDLENFNDSDLGREYMRDADLQSFSKQCLLTLKKQLWYEQMASKPATKLSNLTIYTDASKAEDKVGAAFVAYSDGTEIFAWQEKLEPGTSVFRAEIVAIYQALLWLGRREPQGARVFSDGAVGLRAIDGVSDAGPLVQSTQLLLSELRRRGYAVKLSWIKAHAGFLGNERADQLAKEAAKSTGERLNEYNWRVAPLSVSAFFKRTSTGSYL